MYKYMLPETHDTQFAANHKQAEKIWVKSFDGQFWD